MQLVDSKCLKRLDDWVGVKACLICRVGAIIVASWLLQGEVRLRELYRNGLIDKETGWTVAVSANPVIMWGNCPDTFKPDNHDV